MKSFFYLKILQQKIWSQIFSMQYFNETPKGSLWALGRRPRHPDRAVLKPDEVESLRVRSTRARGSEPRKGQGSWASRCEASEPEAQIPGGGIPKWAKRTEVAPKERKGPRALRALDRGALAPFRGRGRRGRGRVEPEALLARSRPDEGGSASGPAFGRGKPRGLRLEEARRCERRSRVRGEASDSSSSQASWREGRASGSAPCRRQEGAEPEAEQGRMVRNEPFDRE